MSLSFLAQLQAAAGAVSDQPDLHIRFNPNPPGTIKHGSASDIVLKTLRQYGKPMNEGQLRFRTGLNHAKTSWALLFLVRQGLIESYQDPTRNSRYLRYKGIAGEER